MNPRWSYFKDIELRGLRISHVQPLRMQLPLTLNRTLMILFSSPHDHQSLDHPKFHSPASSHLLFLVRNEARMANGLLNGSCRFKLPHHHAPHSCFFSCNSSVFIVISCANSSSFFVVSAIQSIIVMRSYPSLSRLLNCLLISS